MSAEGYFILLHFDGAKRFYSANTPEGKDLDESGNLLFQLGTDSITARWVEIEDEAGTRVRYDLSGVTAAAPVALKRGKAVAKKAAAKKVS